MSSVDNEPEALKGLLQECLAAILSANGHRPDEIKLKGFDKEAVIRQGGSIPKMLASLVEEASNGKAYSVRPASSAVASNRADLKGEIYFVRCSSDTEEREVTHPTDDMILFVINIYTKQLLINVPVQSQDLIDAELARRAQARDAAIKAERVKAEQAAERKVEVELELVRLTSAIEWYIQKSESKEAQEKWSRMNSRHSQHSGVIMLPDLLELCHLLGIDLAMLASFSPTAAKVSH